MSSEKPREQLDINSSANDAHIQESNFGNRGKNSTQSQEKIAYGWVAIRSASIVNSYGLGIQIIGAVIGILLW
jgi:hypothetical protein